MNQRSKWIIVLVAFDDTELEPQVIKERIGFEEDEHLAAFLRGGELIELITVDNEAIAEAERAHVEKQSLR